MKHTRLRSVIAQNQIGVYHPVSDATPVGTQNIKDTAGQKDAFGVDIDVAGFDAYQILSMFYLQGYVKKINAPTGTLTAKIYDYAAGTALWTIGTLDVATISAAGFNTLWIFFADYYEMMRAHGAKVTVGCEFVDTSVDHVNNYLQIISDGAGAGTLDPHPTCNLRTHGNTVWDKADQKFKIGLWQVEKLSYIFDPTYDHSISIS